MKKVFSMFVSALMVLATCLSPVGAADPEGEYECQLYAEVTDAGEVVHKMVIDYGRGMKVSDVTKETFTVHATASTEAIREGIEGVMSYGDYDIDRTIVKVETDGQYVTLYFNEAEGNTLAYLSSGRNFPADLTYTVTQNTPVKVNYTAPDGRELEKELTGTYTCDNTVINEETAKFESVLVEDGINYQFYDAGDADSLIVWFHGNGEGDYLASNNNVAQMLANRGTVAWAAESVQEMFGGAHVMAFQAPDTWYYAQRDGLLEKAYHEIQDVIKAKGINPNKVVVSGCSAGGYMTTRMLIAYPDLFAAAMINCPALSVATIRGGNTPTDEELASIKASDTAIWLVQGVTDASVKREDCSQRLFDILTEGQTLTETRFEQALNSDFTTYETADGKYKLSLYDTVDLADSEDSLGEVRPSGKLEFAEDYDQDGVYTLVKYSDHWSWIYTLNNNPASKDGTHIINWASEVINKEEAAEVEATAQLHAVVTDAGQVVNKMVLDFGKGNTVTNVDKDTFTVHATASTEAIREGIEGVISYGDYDKDRTIVKVETNGQYVTLYFSEAEGATLAYLSSGRNFPADLTYTVTTNKALTVADKEIDTVNCTINASIYDEETAKFESVLVEDGINYQFYDAGDADSLIVWFHGNGEGDYLASNNNVAQMLANRGTVAWAAEGVQEMFGGAHVMAFQAPDTWYYAQRDGLLEKAYHEIQDVIKAKGIDPNKVVVSGCSAGGYMTTRMLIAYPDLFAAAMINCPALDVAQLRGGNTPTDEELASIKASDTAIWLVQGVTDSSVKREDCSQRLFDILTEGQTLTETRFEQALNSDFTTYETADGKYKLSLYDTVDLQDKEDSFGNTRPSGYLEFAEDYDQDGVYTLVKYSDHWSWIYTLNNNPASKDGTHIINWASEAAKAKADANSKPNVPDQPAKPEKPTNVSTGDTAVILPFAALAVAAFVGGAGAVYKKKKESAQ